MTKTIRAALLALALTFVACSDAHECKPDDIDRDNDGRCNE